MDISAANATLSLQIASVFPIPQNIQGFAADDVFDLDQIESVETMMGVDGILSGGFVWKPQPQRVILQADSASNAVFDTWNAQQVATGQAYLANGVIRLPSIGLKIVLSNGYLTGYKLPSAKKLVQPRPYHITWNLALPAPA
jgi:hypothetical protein